MPKLSKNAIFKNPSLYSYSIAGFLEVYLNAHFFRHIGTLIGWKFQELLLFERPDLQKVQVFCQNFVWFFDQSFLRPCRRKYIAALLRLLFSIYFND